MAWNDYITEDGWNSPNYPNTTIINSAGTFAETYSDLIFELYQETSNGYVFNIPSISVVGDNRHPIYFVLCDTTSGPSGNATSQVAPLYSSTFEYHGNYDGINVDLDDAPLAHYPLDDMGSGIVGTSPFDYSGQLTKCEINTNMPIVCVDYYNMDQTTLNNLRSNYMNNGDISILDPYIADNKMIIINSSAPTEQKSSGFTIYNTGQRDMWLKSGRTFIDGPYYRWVRIKLLSTDQVDGRLAFYRQGLSDGVIKLVPVSVASVVSCEFSTDGGATWNESSAFPFEYIYGERENELGEFISATRTGIGGDTGVPLFADETTALGWVNHDPSVDISDALNYEDMAARYGISNKTGIAETTTTMGTASNFKSHFTQKYILDSGEITKISNAFFDTATNIFEDIKKGLEMMGSSIVDAIGGVKYWPVDLTTVFTRLQSQSYIFFGGYQWPPTGDPTSVTVYKLLGYDGYLSLGTFTIEKSFPGNDYRNYEPYCNVSIYLPYVGLQKLSYNKYVGKTTEVRYYLDINTGGCLACLLCDGKLYDYFNGQMGVDIPITVTDYAGFATAELQNISNLAGVGGNASGALTMGASGNIGGAAIATAGAIGAFEKSMYDLQTTSINNFNNTKGGSGAIGNEYLPQYVYLIFEYIKTEETPNLINLAGRASNASGTLGSFSGYLEVDEVELKTSAGMTEAEKNNFISLLHSGIII